MKSTKELSDFRSMDEGELLGKVESLKEELMKLRFRHASGQLEQTAQLLALKKSVARANTILAEKTKEVSN